MVNVALFTFGNEKNGLPVKDFMYNSFRLVRLTGNMHLVFLNWLEEE